jgi:hypothetical protein
MTVSSNKPSKTPFDNNYMRSLYETGYEMPRNGYLGKGLLRDFEIEALPTRNRESHTFASKQILGVSTRRASDAGELHSPPDFLWFAAAGASGGRDVRT